MIKFNRFYTQFNIASLILVIISLCFLIFKGLNFGIDFKGGTLIELRSSYDKINVSSLRDNLSKIDLGDGTKFDKSWKLDSKKSNYWNKFSENTITWVEVVLPENNDDNKYSYTYFKVDRMSGSLVAEFSVGVNYLLKKNHKKPEIFGTLYGKCIKGSGEKIF